MKRLLATCDPDWIPTLVFQAFCGLRPEEVCPEKDTGKQGIQWEDVLWDKGKVNVPASASKVRRRRFAALTEAAMAFLLPHKGASGPVVGKRRFWHYLADWKKRDGIVWKPDGLRHSFASYRLAVTKDVQALALEMGNSAAMIFKHYLDLKHEDEGKEWFAIRPV